MGLHATQDRIALLKIETTYGTDSVPVAAQAILLMNSQLSPQASKLDRKVDRPYYGGDPFVLVGKKVTLTADCDILGSMTLGLAAPLGVLYRICCHAETLLATTSATYNPIAHNLESGTIYFYWAGILCKMTGVRGEFGFEQAVKTFGMGKVSLTGLFSIPTDASLPAGIDLSAFVIPPAIEMASWAVTVGGTAVNATKLTLVQGGKIDLYEGSETNEVYVADRKPAGALTLYKDQLLSVYNPWAIADAQTPVTLSSIVTKAAGLNSAIAIHAQFEYPKLIDINGVAGYEWPYSAVPITGNDEYSVVLT